MTLSETNNSVISYQLSVISNQLPVTSYQLPVISYQLPVTSYQFMLRTKLILLSLSPIRVRYFISREIRWGSLQPVVILESKL